MLDAQVTEEFIEEIVSSFDTVTTPESLGVIMDAHLAAIKPDMYRFVLKALRGTETLRDGFVNAVTITTAGTGYVAGTLLNVSGDGVGAIVRIDTVSVAGAITGVSIAAKGSGYTSATVDLTGAGEGDGVLALTVKTGMPTVDAYEATLA